MKSLAFLAVIIGCAFAVNLERLFNKYSANHVMTEGDMGNFWMHFDIDGNGNVSKGEFDATWNREDLGDEDRAPFYFIEMDRVMDEVINMDDVPHIFKLFDENGDGQVTYSEFRFNWEGLFDN